MSNETTSTGYGLANRVEPTLHRQEMEMDMDMLHEETLRQAAELEPDLPMMPFLITDASSEEVVLRPAYPVAMQQTLPEANNVRPPSSIAKDILKATAERYGVPVEAVIGDSRKRGILPARHTAIYLIREYTDLSLSQIGKMFSHRNHSTVMHSIKRVKESLGQPGQGSIKREYIDVFESLVDTLDKSEDQQPDQLHLVTVTPEGLFKCPLFDTTQQQRYLLGMDAEVGLQWSKRQTDPELWESYGRDALNLLRRLKREVRPNTSNITVAY